MAGLPDELVEAVAKAGGESVAPGASGADSPMQSSRSASDR